MYVFKKAYLSSVVILKSLNCFQECINGMLFHVNQCYFECVFFIGTIQNTIPHCAHFRESTNQNTIDCFITESHSIAWYTMHIPLNGKYH